MNPMNILLIAGGWSPEREISLKGAEIILKSLTARGHTVTFYDLEQGFEDLCTLAKKVDVAFINLHGSPGEDGLVQAFLERLNCPYQGSNPAASFLALHKYAAKALFQNAGLNTAKGFFLASMPSDERLSELMENLVYPLFVKSNDGGSSLHLYRTHNKQECTDALNNIFNAGHEALVEELVTGKEITCGVLGEKALPPILILPKGEFFDFTNKYAADGAEEICPAPISLEMTQKVQAMALKAHKALGLSDYSRSDFIMTAENEFFLLETNTLPGMTATSLVPQEAKEIGMEFHELLEALLEMAMNKKK